MKMNKWVSGAACMAILLSGCGQNSANDGKETNTETKSLLPVTLKIYNDLAYISERDFKEMIAEPVKKKYPHLTVEQVATRNDLDKLIAAGEAVDFFVTWNGQMAFYKDLGFFEDITPLAKKNNFDLEKFDPGALDAIRTVSENGKELYALPYAVQLNALYYNKTIFDRFGATYPKDGMTWTDAIELAKKVSRKEGDVQYYGLDTDDYVRFTFPLSLGAVDAKTNKALVNSEPYKRAFDMAKQLYSSTGVKYQNKGIERFTKDQTVAMIATINLFQQLKQSSGLDWDVAQFPSYPDKPNVYGMYDLHILIPNRNSKNQDDMMRTMEVLFSDEVQTNMVRKTGRVSTLKDVKYKQQFGKDIPELQGKRIESIFKSTPAPAPEYSRYYPKAAEILRWNYVDYMNGVKDVNTALRDAEEAINKQIDGQQGK
ncbi:ABC transporter substrate-binding protein [Paenibacillus ginsengarvi]|uniref:Carbohydrate ABC transporter substrate-binding protein n=1 Tax=Paenibacillus ginsengarvi TaxID=400777 RepID=A0A3B0CDG4_9BACL|nr:ABC transporter substrate-binding protein [Paenibacillus ginsengarvi]RKN81937.1 carbohydrate ABC transporter substrate-binding protein [Paenibacillus ginsengarvi]